MTDRWQLYHIHRLSRRHNLDLDTYKELKHQHALVSENLDRLEDELQVTNFKIIQFSTIFQLLLTEEITSIEQEKVNENDSFLDF